MMLAGAFAAAPLLMSQINVSAATTYQWIGGTSNWSATTNWNPNGSPGTGDTANLTTASNSPAGTITYDYTGSAVTLSSFQVDGTSVQTFAMPADNLNVAGNEIVGNSQTGTFNQTGGTNTITVGGSGDKLILGNAAHSSGTYFLSGSASLSTPQEIVGDPGRGIFNQSGGSNTVTSASNSGIGIVVGAGSGSTGTFYLSGGTLSCAEEELIGWTGGVGTFIQTSGTHSLTSSTYALFIGVNGSGGPSGYSLAGNGALNVASAEIVGQTSAAYFNQSGGTNTISGSAGLELGSNVGGAGTYSLTGGTLTLNGAGYIGGGLSGTTPVAGGKGVLSISGSGILNAASLTTFNTSGTGITLNGGTINTALLTLAQGSLLTEYIAGTTASGYGQTDVTGTITLNNPTLSLDLTYSPAIGDAYTLIDNQGTNAVAGTFAGLPQGAMFTDGDPSGRSDVFEISYTGGTGNNSVVVTTIAVPEPASVLIAGTGALFFSTRRRRAVRSADRTK